MLTCELLAIKPWTRPDSWWGKSWDGWYVGLGRSRDSSALEESNFRCFERALDALPTIEVDDSENARGYYAERDGRIWNTVDGVQVVRESHWAVGWIEWIAIHKDNTAALKLADEMLCGLADYPVLDEEDFSALETEQIENFWQQESLRYRVEMCAEHGESIFAARRCYPPERVFDYLRDTWL